MNASFPLRSHPIVLVADDDANVRLLIREALEAEGFQVEEAIDGLQTLAQFVRHHPDIILLDVLMPGRDGFSVCTEIRRDPAGERLPILMVTSLNDVNSITRAYEVGATDFITKPISWLTLGHRVRYVLRASRAMEDLITSQEALRESEERFRQLAENVQQAFWMADVSTPTPRLLYISPGYEEISGFPVNSLADFPRPFYARIHPEDQARILAATTNQNEGSPSDEEYRILRADGAVRWIRERTFPVSSTRRTVARIVGIAEDITERKRLERQRNDFLAMVTHDIKNPLGIILGYADMLLESAEARHDAEDQEQLDRLRSNASTVLSLVTNYLDLSRIEAGQLTLMKQPVAINDLILRIGQQYSAAAQRRNLTLEFHLAPALPLIESDRVAFERILTNLLHNALKFTPPIGTITLSSTQQGAFIVLSVRNTGPGIASVDLPHLFDKYHQALSPSRREGTGLGLFIVKSLVELHGGRVTVNSSHTDGTTFSVFLPIPATTPSTAVTAEEESTTAPQG